eukprot:CAMPEP_0170576964 /NCGR_PEP_ID=MMETSP0224-20130122/4672_1 /TAXON_ID=285029 /ORGANISM="Togula jolla, Strain CCCM 725" /LENGTH=32 /DNA_ID= /DNA_START= /DNA_END= /DNA_ORIENTATION=
MGKLRILYPRPAPQGNTLILKLEPQAKKELRV